MIEANAKCEHGEWLKWLDQFDWGWNTATRYMGVAKLGAKFPNLKFSKLAATTLYALLDYDENHENDMPAIVVELDKHARKKQLAVCDAECVINIGLSRSRFGDHPDATLAELGDLAHGCSDSDWYQKAVDGLLKIEPTTDEDAEAISNDAMGASHEDSSPEPSPSAEDSDDDGAGDDAGSETKPFEGAEDSEIEKILDGSPPDVSPPALKAALPDYELRNSMGS